MEPWLPGKWLILGLGKDIYTKMNLQSHVISKRKEAVEDSYQRLVSEVKRKSQPEQVPIQRWDNVSIKESS